MRLSKIIAAIIALSFLVVLSGCSHEIGSKEWCDGMKKKPKKDWTAQEATDYTKQCFFK